MKSIKEKANEVYPELSTDSDDWDVIEEQCDRDDQRKAFVLGANYVLDAVEEATNICFDEELKRVIKQLKGNQ